MKKIIKNFIKVIFCTSILMCNVFLCYADGWKNINGDTYYVKDDGSFLTGFIILDGVAYYCGSDGKMKKSNEIGTWLLVNDEFYQGKFYVDHNGVVTMNDNDGAHWVKIGRDWYHYSNMSVVDKDLWILRKEDNRIYRVGYDGKMCRGWVADPLTHVRYFCEPSEDGGYVIMDDMNSTYDETYARLIEIINKDFKSDGSEVSKPRGE